MKLSVIIVNYNVRLYLEQSLMSLRRALRGIDAEVFVVDNHSRDGSVEYLSKRFPRVTFVSSNHNLGFARANNIAIKRCIGQYVLLLNPDTIVGESVLQQALAFMDAHPQAGGAGVRMIKSDGRDAMESRRGLPTPMTAFYKMSGLAARYPQSRRFGRYYMSYLPWDEAAPIEVISGAFCLLRHSALDSIGLLDEDFFMYGEDIDLSFRLLKSGFENWYLPLRILHYKGESTQKTSFRYVHVFYGAMLIFLRKHYPNMGILLSVPIKTAIYAKAFAALVAVNMQRMRKGLGFVLRRRDKEPLYVFVGSHTAMAECRRIAERKGIEARYHEVDTATIWQGHARLDLPTDRIAYIVYDTETFTFDDIFAFFAAEPCHRVHIGTYNQRSKTIVTVEEVLQ